MKINNDIRDLLYRCLRNGEQLLVPPFSGAEGSEDAGNPTSYLLVLAPIMQDDEPQGVIEIFQRPTAGPRLKRDICDSSLRCHKKRATIFGLIDCASCRIGKTCSRKSNDFRGLPTTASIREPPHTRSRMKVAV